MFVGFDPFLGLILSIDFDVVMATFKISKSLFRICLLRVEPPYLSIEFTHVSQYAPSDQYRKPVVAERRVAFSTARPKSPTASGQTN